MKRKIVSSFGRDINIGYDSCDLMKKMIEYSYKKADKICIQIINGEENQG